MARSRLVVSWAIALALTLSAYVPRAGCYVLEARWDSGDWRLVFGLGR
jgi:hypothetical protein